MKFFNVKDVFKTKNLALMGILLAMAVVINYLSFYATTTFRIVSFTYLPGMVVSVILGPIAGMIFAVAADTLCFFTRPEGGYFFGYAISALLANFIYALFLYRRQLKLYKVIIAQLLITLIINMGLNFVWISIMIGKVSGTFFTSARLLNNLLQLPFHIVLVYFIIKFLQSRKVISG